MSSSRPRSILHADLDAFYASVAQRDDPSLRGRPVIVGGGVVLAASYEARAAGVRGAMGGRRARELCPDAVEVPTDWPAYTAASRAVRSVLERHAPTVEAVSIDEAYLDVTGLEHVTGTPEAIGRRIRAEVREEVGLPITVGGGDTRVLAKVAGASAKPDGLLVVPPGEELAVLHPLPVGRLPGVGPRTLPRLEALGVATIGDLAACPEQALAAVLGRSAARHLRGLALDRDPAPVRSGRRRRSLGAQSALGRPTASAARIDEALLGLADKVGRRLRAAGLRGRTITLRLRFGDYERASRSATLVRPTDDTAAVLARARELLAANRAAVVRRRLTLVGIALTNLEPATGRQLELPLHDEPDRAALDAAVDGVRERFGATALTRGALVGHSAEAAPWLGPDDVPAPR